MTKKTKRSLINRTLGKIEVRFPLIAWLRRSANLRLLVFLWGSILIDFFYATTKTIIGCYLKDAFAITIGSYYIILTTARVILSTRFMEDDFIRQWKSYRMTGVFLLISAEAIGAIGFYIAFEGRSPSYYGHFIYAMAAYVFYAIISSAINLKRIWRHNNPVLSAAKSINLVTALVSLMSLASALISRFGDARSVFAMSMNSSLRGAVVIVTIVLSIYMLVVSNKAIRRIKRGDVTLKRALPE